MIVDSSALIAILLNEVDAPDLLAALHSTPERLIGSPTWLETSLVFEGRATSASFGRLDEVVAGLGISIVPFDAELAALARDANRRYGGRPARLNFGDCMAYALAKHTGLPLLFKGNDFAQTDITAAAY